MEEKPLISILIPVYNTEKYIRRCIESAMCQSYDNLEIVVVDDGSKDSSLSIIQELANKDKRIKEYSKTNEKNIAKTRNYLLERVNGKYFTFLDSDDYLNKNHILNLYNNMVKYDSDISVCGYFINFFRWKRFSLGIRNGSMNKDDLLGNVIITTKFNVSLWNKLFKSELASDLRFDETIKTGEDIIFCYNYLKMSNKLSYTKKKSYNYYLRPGSEIHQKFSDKHVSYIDGLYELMMNEENELYKSVLKAVISISSAFLVFKMKRAHYDNQEMIDKCKKYAKEYKKDLFSNPYTAGFYKFGYRLLNLICLKK